MLIVILENLIDFSLLGWQEFREYKLWTLEVSDVISENSTAVARDPISSPQPSLPRLKRYKPLIPLRKHPLLPQPHPTPYKPPPNDYLRHPQPPQLRVRLRLHPPPL